MCNHFVENDIFNGIDSPQMPGDGKIHPGIGLAGRVNQCGDILYKMAAGGNKKGENNYPFGSSLNHLFNGFL